MSKKNVYSTDFQVVAFVVASQESFGVCVGRGIWRRQINYFSETWHFCNKNSADKLEMVNKRALRFVFRDTVSPRLMRNSVSVSVSQVFVNSD